MKCWVEIESHLVEKQEEKRIRYDADYSRTDAGFSLIWEEQEENNPVFINSFLKWDSKKQKMIVTRKGERETELLFVPHEETAFSIATDFGNFDGRIQTQQINIAKNENSLFYCINIEYDLIFQDQAPQSNKMELFFGFLEEKCFFQESSRILA